MRRLGIISGVVLWGGLGFGDWYNASLVCAKPEFLFPIVSATNTLLDTLPEKPAEEDSGRKLPVALDGSFDVNFVRNVSPMQGVSGRIWMYEKVAIGLEISISVPGIGIYGPRILWRPFSKCGFLIGGGVYGCSLPPIGVFFTPAFSCGVRKTRLLANNFWMGCMIELINLTKVSSRAFSERRNILEGMIVGIKLNLIYSEKRKEEKL